MITLRTVRWAGHITQKGRSDMNTEFCLESLRESDCSEDEGVDGKMILK
jgi:hypothetical protein